MISAKMARGNCCTATCRERKQAAEQANNKPEQTPMELTGSRPLGLRLGSQVDRALAAEVVEMRVEEIARGTAAAVAQHNEEIVVGAELAGRGQLAERLVERDAMHVDAAGLGRTSAARDALLVAQA